jgi:hypothetical protein
MMRLKEQCARGSNSNQKNFTPQVSRDLWNSGTNVSICVEIMLKNKCCLYVIISIRFFSNTICNLFIELPSYFTLIKRIKQIRDIRTVCHILWAILQIGTHEDGLGADRSQWIRSPSLSSQMLNKTKYFTLWTFWLVFRSCMISRLGNHTG